MDHDDSDPAELELLRVLRLVGLAPSPQLAQRLGLDAGDLLGRLEGLDGAGLVLHRTGRLEGWSLTAAGRQRLAALASGEVERSGARSRLEAVHGRFVPVNAAFLELCTAWQLRPADPSGASGAHTTVVNDHADVAYDRAVVARLGRIHGDISAILDDAAQALTRFAAYSSRLGHALARVESGEHDWFTRPVIDSYHTVWFELHEDLLTTLGLVRSTETAPR